MNAKKRSLQNEGMLKLEKKVPWKDCPGKQGSGTITSIAEAPPLSG